MRWICATLRYGISIVNISSAIFNCSAPDLDSCPDESLPEFAFIGRSNVGKSSLLNLLAGERGMASVSSTPGFTKLINVFTINKCWRLVDLPGYGFAQGARRQRARFNQAVADYLVKAGLPANRFSAVGYGATQPIAGNDTDQGKAQNRRIDFVVK